MKAAFVLVAACVLVVVGCSSRPSNVDRGNKLMALAAEEAGLIKPPAQRLTQQLNIAELQIVQGQKDNASKTLAAACKTIQDAAKDFDTQVAMAGYVSISQLGRRIGDRDVASQACDGALALLQEIKPEQVRCPYVHAMAGELKELRGNDASSKFVREAGPWCKGIDDPTDRREALVLFSSDLFGCEDYAGGQELLRNDEDAAWRSRTLLAMARTSLTEAQQEKANSLSGADRTVAAPMSVAAEMPSKSMRNDQSSHMRKTNYARQIQLGYERNFQGRQEPQTQPAE